MITPSFSLTATERVLPRLAIDFTTASLDPRITFSRTGATATQVNSSGLIENVAADIPRFDYDPVTFVCKGLLIEATRTNLLTNSNEFGATGWNTPANASISAAAATSPDGTNNASKLIENAATSEHSINLDPPITVAANTAHTLTVYAKAAERTQIGLMLVNSSYTNGVRYVFDLSNGAVLSGTPVGAVVSVSGSIVDASGGWYRCSVTAVVDTTSTAMNFNIATAAGGTTFYTGDNTSGIYIWGAQLEAGAFATSYIPTEATTVTRNADVATMTGTDFSDWYSAGAGGVVARVLPSTVSGTRPALQFDDATADEVITLRGNTTNPELVIIDGGASQVQIDAGIIAANTAYNLGAAWNTNDCAAAVNGGAAVTDTTATIPTVTQARLGSDGTNYLNGHFQILRYWPQRIINAEVQAFSK